MNPRLLEYIVCPDDHANLTLSVEYKKQNETKRALGCRGHCGLTGEPIKKLPCERCTNEEVIQGSLHCTQCHEEFPIMDGIPRLLSKKHSLIPQKKREREVRDAEAEIYEKMYDPDIYTEEIQRYHRWISIKSSHVICGFRMWGGTSLRKARNNGQRCPLP